MLPAELMVVIILRVSAVPLVPSLLAVDIYTEPSLFPPTMVIEADPEYDYMMTCMFPDCERAVWMMVIPPSVPAGPGGCGSS